MVIVCLIQWNNRVRTAVARVWKSKKCNKWLRRMLALDSSGFPFLMSLSTVPQTCESRNTIMIRRFRIHSPITNQSTTGYHTVIHQKPPESESLGSRNAAGAFCWRWTKQYRDSTRLNKAWTRQQKFCFIVIQHVVSLVELCILFLCMGLPDSLAYQSQQQQLCLLLLQFRRQEHFEYCLHTDGPRAAPVRYRFGRRWAKSGKVIFACISCHSSMALGYWSRSQ